jgi:formylglycine-generating enzyme required for sulfatase activity
MGSDDKHRELETASPAHQVEVERFCIDRHEVTAAIYDACVNDGRCEALSAAAAWPRSKTDTVAGYTRAIELYSEHCNAGKPGRRAHPANCLTFEQAAAVCRYRDARLPSEAEWEYAARGSDGRIYPWGDAAPGPAQGNGCGVECRRWHERVRLDAPFDRVLYDADDGYEGSAPVGAFPAGKTREGVEDLIGNVSEWVADPFRPYQGAAQDADDASKMRVIRGGSFLGGSPQQMDAAARVPMHATVRSPAVGFRCAARANP